MRGDVDIESGGEIESVLAGASNRTQSMIDTRGFTLVTGAELPTGQVALASNHPQYDATEQPHTAVVYRAPGEDVWQAGGFFARPTASAALNASSDAVLFIDPNGTVAHFRPEGGSKLSIRANDPRYAGRAIRFIRNIDGLLIAGGAGHTLHVSDRGAPWSDITEPEMERTPQPRGFEDAGGFSRDEIYCVGWKGAIWSRIDGTWSEVESPTSLLLTSVDVGTDRAFAAGKMGTILEGRGGDWRAVEHDVTDHEILDIATYDGATYFSGFFGLLKWRDGDLAIEWLAGDEIESAGTLFVGPSGLWSVGSTTLALYDGNEWQVVLQT